MRRALAIGLLAACGGGSAPDPNPPFTFDVPAGTTGFTLVVSGPAGPADFLGVQTLTDPSGRTSRPRSGQNGQTVVAVRVPLPDDAATQPLPSGTWTAKLGGVTGNPKDPKGGLQPLNVKLSAEVKLQAGGETLDLDVYVPKGLALHGTTLEARWTIAFGLVDRLFGWKRGDVRLHEVDARFATLAGQADVDAANRLVTATAGAQVVLTNDLSPEGTGSISGLSCVPGAVRTPGTVCSAVLVSLRDGAEPWHDAATLVHELGHFAGLEHSTEFSGQTDALSDTPACTNLEKAALASCPDHDNLMFPSVNSATSVDAISVSATQRALMRSSLLPR